MSQIGSKIFYLEEDKHFWYDWEGMTQRESNIYSEPIYKNERKEHHKELCAACAEGKCSLST